MACKPVADKREKLPDAAFMDYITAYTGGVVSSSSSVDIHLNPAILGKIDKTADVDLGSLFDFSPSIEGDAYWMEDNLLVFRPISPLESGQAYQATFNLSKLLKVPDPLKKFPFSFEVIRQSFTVDIEGVYSGYEDFGLVEVKGALLFADMAAPEEIEKILKAEYSGNEMKIRWQHRHTEKMSSFIIDSIARAEDEAFLMVSWSGKSLGLKEQGETRVAIPSRNKFEVTQAQVSHQPEQYISILFSDPLSEQQSLKGLIGIDGAGEVRLSTERNELKVYPSNRLQGNQTLRIDGSVKSILGKPLGTNQEIILSFDAFYPAVKFVASGNILPQSDRLVLPFQAVNLTAVDVRVIRIYESNIPQFMQSNNLDGNYQLNRVGRPVLKKKIDLKPDKPVDFSQWNTFFLDLGEMIRVEPGAIYNVRISFDKDYSAYPCDERPLTGTDESEDYYYGGGSENFDWDADGYFYDDYYPRGFVWRERDNPCHISYYYNDRFISKNILASNLGIIAKAGSEGKYTIAVTDLVSTTPVSGARIELLNFQQQKITEARTNTSGIAEIESPQKPFLLVADYNGQKGYLKLDDGSSLSLSKFKTEGEAVEDGLKGMIYGERGVWRPGDTLFLMFILQDEEKRLPADHPVIFELIDPAGQSIQKTVRTANVNGFYNFTTATTGDARTGFYQAKVSIGNVVFRKSLRIESIKPNRLKIDLAFNTPMLKANSATTPATITARWLHGGTASGMKATVNQIFSKRPVKFDNFKDYTFEDPGKELRAEEQVIFDQKLDGAGKAVIQLDTKGNFNAPGMLTANFQVKVFEPSGEFSIDQVSIPYAPYPRFIGVKLNGRDKWGFLKSDSSYRCDLVAVDAHGDPVNSAKVQVMVYSMEWRWWWNAGENDLASYFSTSYRTPLVTETVSLTNGKGTFNLDTKYMDWGRYFIKVTDPAGGHSTGINFYVSRYGWWDRSGEQGREFATMLEFSSDKEKYKIGEKAIITFPAGKTGKAWITIENGSRILSSEWVDISSTSMDYSFMVTPDMAPNVYVSISLLQPHNQTLNDLPIRLYGTIPVMAEDPESIIKPVISAPKEIAPEEKYTIKVREEKGKAMTYTLVVVDEGLLDLTRFKTPDPWNHFFAKEALGVKTWDMFDMVIGAFGGKLERVLAIGGDGSLATGDKAKVNRFKPVVRFIGPVALKARGENTHQLVMPNYVGSVRVMVVAANDYPAYGMAEETIPVKQPVMVLATLPRVLGPGEKVKLPVNVFMMEDERREVTVSVETNENLILSGPKQKKIQFSGAGEQLVEFDLLVGETTGAGSVTINAASGRDKATYHFDIGIRNPNPPVKNHYFTKLEAGKEWKQQVSMPGLEGTNSMKLEVSALLPLNLSKHMDYLLDYPYGCAEQITSAAFPQLFLGDLAELNPDQKILADNNVKWTINRLHRFQNRDGSFNFWPDYASSNDYISSYIGHFLIEAGKKGYSVSNALIKPWLSYQKAAAGRWDSQHGNDLVQAYRLYTLALAGEPQIGAMNKLREQSNLSGPAISCLASAYALSGQKEAAGKVFEKYAYSSENNTYYYTYGSSLRNMAMKLEALNYLEEEDEAAKLAFDIALDFGKEVYYSTQTTAYVLQALSKYSGKYKKDKELKYTYQFGKGAAETVTTPYKFSLKEWANPVDGELKVVNEGQGDIFIRMATRGTPLTDNLPAVDKNIKLSAEFFDMSGNKVDPASLPQGLDFTARVTVSFSAVPRGQDNLALSMIFPSGWEILKRSATGFEADYTGKNFDYQDIRDDRVYTFFHLNPGQSKTFSVFLNATYQGSFFMPAISCEAMYDEGIYSRLAGKWIKVIPSE